MEIASDDTGLYAGRSANSVSHPAAAARGNGTLQRGSVHNVADAERMASVAVGVALVALGVKRRDAGGAVAALLGGALIHRGATGHCMVYQSLGVSTGDAEAVLDAPRRDVT